MSSGAAALPLATKGRNAINASLPRLAALGILLFLATACDSRRSPEGGPARVVPSVEAVQARYGALPLTQRLSGVVRARNQIEIYPQISAMITEVLVQNGGTVRAGQPLVRLRDLEFSERLKQARAAHRIAAAQLRRAEAQAREVRAELDRARSLAEQGLNSQVELETTEAQAESAEAEIELARARLEQALASAEEQEENLTQTVIRASISGSVGNVDAEVGMLAAPGRRLFTLGQLDSVRVDVILTDRMLAFIEEGQRTEISTGGVAASAPLSRISPFLHPIAHSTEAQIDLANPGGALKPGMFVTVDVFYGESAAATLVPLSALYENPATGVVGLFVTKERFEPEPVDERGIPQSLPLSEPIAFEFIPADVVAQGSMEAGVRGIDPEVWVVTLGQNLLGGDAPQARVRPVAWERVERLQRLQREDLMRDVIERRSSE